MKIPTAPCRSRGIRRLMRDATALALVASGTAYAADAPSTPSAEAPTQPPEEAKSEPEAGAASAEPQSYANWVEMSLGGTFVNGNEAAFQQRTGLPIGAYGGVSSFHYEQEVAKGTTLTADGRGIFGNEDYAIQLELKKDDLGYVQTGYSEYRTYYNGSGGYFPNGNLWYGGIFDPQLAIDNTHFWFEAGFRKPEVPQFTIRYDRLAQEGNKDSTHWGAVDTPDGLRSIVPAFWDIDEVRNLVSIDAAHTIGSTALGLGFRYEHQDFNDSLNERMFPNGGPILDRAITQREQVSGDLYNVHALSESTLRTNLLFTVGYAYTAMDTDVSGYRRYGSAYDPDVSQALPDPNTFSNLSGNPRLGQNVANVNMMWTLARSLVLVPAVRIESQNIDGQSTYGQPGPPLSSTPYSVSGDSSLLDVSEALELRYTGFTNVVLTARGDWLQGQGDLDEDQMNDATGASVVFRSTDDERRQQKYSLGASWYPSRKVNMAAGYYYKIRSNDFDHDSDSTSNLPGSPSRYPAYLTYLNYTVNDGNFRVTWRPQPTLTLTGRYDIQFGEMQSQADGLSTQDTADLRLQIASGTVNWVPWRRLYLQGQINYVWNETESPISDVTPAVQNAENNYWTTTATVGYALRDDMDVEASYFYYQANDYVNNAAFGMPYGAGLEDQGVTATFTWRVSPRVRWLVKYAFVTSTDEASGGNNDYDASVLSTSIQYRF